MGFAVVPMYLGIGTRGICWGSEGPIGGLGAFGQAGVERVLDLVNRELVIASEAAAPQVSMPSLPTMCMTMATASRNLP